MEYINRRKVKKLLRKIYVEVLKPEKYTCYSGRYANHVFLTEKEYKDILNNMNIGYLWRHYQENLGIIPNGHWWEDGFEDTI